MRSSARVTAILSASIFSIVLGYFFIRKRRRRSQNFSSVDTKTETEQSNCVEEYEKIKSQGNKSYLNADYKQAAEYFEKSLTFCSDDKIKISIIYQNLASTYEMLNELDRAVECCEKSINANPNYSKAYFRFGCLLNKKKNFKKASEYFSLAMKSNKQAPIKKKFEQNMDLLIDELLNQLPKADMASNVSFTRFYNIITSFCRDPIFLAMYDFHQRIIISKNFKENDNPNLVQNILSEIDSICLLLLENNIWEAYKQANWLIKEKTDMKIETEQFILNFLATVDFALDIEESSMKKLLEIKSMANISPDMNVNISLKLHGRLILNGEKNIEKSNENLKMIIENYPNHPDVKLYQSSYANNSEILINDQCKINDSPIEYLLYLKSCICSSNKDQKLKSIKILNEMMTNIDAYPKIFAASILNLYVDISLIDNIENFFKAAAKVLKISSTWPESTLVLLNLAEVSSKIDDVNSYIEFMKSILNFDDHFDQSYAVQIFYLNDNLKLNYEIISKLFHQFQSKCPYSLLLRKAASIYENARLASIVK